MSLVHVTGKHKAAFRCKNCGHLVPAMAAGEGAVPYACPVCRAGIEIDALDSLARDACVQELLAASRDLDLPAVDAAAKKLQQLPLKRVYRPENWEVLADATPGRLAELGLTPEEVERHTPSPFSLQPFGGDPQNRVALALDGSGAHDSAG